MYTVLLCSLEKYPYLTYGDFLKNGVIYVALSYFVIIKISRVDGTGQDHSLSKVWSSEITKLEGLPLDAI